MPPLSVSLRWPGAYLIVTPEPRLPGVGPSRARASDRSPDPMGGGVAQDEGVSIGWESNDELLSWGPVVLPVVHDVILQRQQGRERPQQADGLVMSY